MLINRSGKNGKLWSPTKDSRVCSDHFIDGKPSAENPIPTLKLGYRDGPKKAKRILFQSQLSNASMHSSKKRKVTKSSQVYEVVPDPPVEMEENTPPPTTPLERYMIDTSFVILMLFNLLSTYYRKCRDLQLKVLSLQSQVELLKAAKKTSVSDNLLKCDKDVNFYTGIDSKNMFAKLHDYIAPYVQRRWRGISALCKNIRKFGRKPKRFGPARYLKPVDEFLLTLMRLRLGLLNFDLARRFDISEALASQIFHSWLKAMASVFGKMVFIPDMETLIATKPQRYRHLPDLHSIIDCTEIFIETPKDLYCQSATWSDYKHHNTLKVLVSVAPNSSIIYVSKAYMGRMSDKALTLDCGYLDKMPQYSMLMADKGFNLDAECATRSITLSVPPGKRGQAQMSLDAIRKTKRIANLRILVEQVIRRLKTFRLLKYELPLNLVPCVDSIVTVCAALSNTKVPFYET